MRPWMSFPITFKSLMQMMLAFSRGTDPSQLLPCRYENPHLASWPFLFEGVAQVVTTATSGKWYQGSG